MTDEASFDETTHDDDWNGTRVDRLISRIVDRCAEPGDWGDFTALAHAEPSHWEQLLSTLRTDVALRSALAGALATADTVETPLPSLSRWRQWTGWAAAGVLALCWAGSSPGTSRRRPPSRLRSRPSQSGLVASQPPAQPEPTGQPAPGSPTPTIDSQLASWNAGKPVEQLPLRLMEARPGPSGRGIEVTFVRPVVERAVVDGVYSIGTDELGRPAPVLVDPATLAAPNKL
jgi:hypothetical protein